MQPRYYLGNDLTHPNEPMPIPEPRFPMEVATLVAMRNREEWKGKTNCEQIAK